MVLYLIPMIACHHSNLSIQVYNLSIMHSWVIYHHKSDSWCGIRQWQQHCFLQLVKKYCAGVLLSIIELCVPVVMIVNWYNIHIMWSNMSYVCLEIFGSSTLCSFKNSATMVCRKKYDVLLVSKNWGNETGWFWRNCWRMSFKRDG